MNGISDFGLADRDLLQEIARETVRRVAPEELPLFPMVATVYFDRGGRRPNGRAGRDEMLGFGLEAAVILLTPVVLPVVSAILDQLAQDVARVVTDGGKDGLRRAMRALLRRATEAENDALPAVPPLTPEQLARVRMTALEKARQMDLPEDKAELLADAVIGSLGG